MTGNQGAKLMEGGESATSAADKHRPGTPTVIMKGGKQPSVATPRRPKFPPGAVIQRRVLYLTDLWKSCQTCGRRGGMGPGGDKMSGCRLTAGPRFFANRIGAAA